MLQARTPAGETWRMKVIYSNESAAMLKAFERAVRQDASPGGSTPIQRERGFFEPPISTKVLGWLAAASAAIVACGLWWQVPAVDYALPMGMMLLTYVSLWAMYSDKRPWPAAMPATFLLRIITCLL